MERQDFEKAKRLEKDIYLIRKLLHKTTDGRYVASPYLKKIVIKTNKFKKNFFKFIGTAISGGYKTETEIDVPEVVFDEFGEIVAKRLIQLEAEFDKLVSKKD